MEKNWFWGLIIILLFFPLLGVSQVGPPASPVERGISVTVRVPGEAPPSPPGAEPPLPPPAKVTFEGMAYPGAFVTILRNKIVVATREADSKGDFSVVLSAVPAGVWNFGIFAEDPKARKSVTISFSVGIIGGTEMKVSGIFISPTIALSTGSVIRGEKLGIEGYAYPESEVEIFVFSPFFQKTKSAKKGEWYSSLDTTPLSLGIHQTKARVRTAVGEESYFSEELAFNVIEGCRGADLNFDNRVNIVDFSILLYFWGQRKPANICADINQDGIVDIVDFSIMMYWWTS